MSNGDVSVSVAMRQGNFMLDAALRVPGKGVTGIFGPSGCGKTTVLRCIAGLEPDSRGTVSINNVIWQTPEKFVPSWRRSIGYVFQDARLFPHMSVERNLAYGCRRSGDASPAGMWESVVRQFELGRLMDRKPGQLSGGERQRVAIARVLLRSPSLVLMDEPLSNLDVSRKHEIMPFLDHLCCSLSVPMLYVSHDLDEITRLCDHLVCMEGGRVMAQGKLQDVLMRTDLPMLSGGEASTVIDVSVLGYDSHYQLSRLSFSGGELLVPGKYEKRGPSAHVRIMAKDVSLSREQPGASSILNILPATVESQEIQPGGYALVKLRVGDVPLLARITCKSADVLKLEQGVPVYAQIKGVAVKGASEDPMILSGGN